MSHLQAVWPALPLLPEPEGGLYDQPTPENFFSARTWANAEVAFEVKAMAAADRRFKKFAAAFLVELPERDQVLDFNTTLATNPIRFINVAPLPLPGADASGNAILSPPNPATWAWSCYLKDLLQNYRNAYQTNIDRGYTGQTGAVG